MFEHSGDGSEINDTFATFGTVLKVFTETAKATKPSQGALDNPADRNDDEAFGIGRTIGDFKRSPPPVFSNHSWKPAPR